MPDQPDVTNGTRQPSHRIAARFDLNEGFVRQVGEAKAEQFHDVLMEVAGTHFHRPLDEIKAALKRGLGRIGMEISDVEIDSFADQINRSDEVLDHDDESPYDADSGRSD